MDDQTPILLVSHSLLQGTVAGMRLCDITPWLADENPVWPGLPPLALLLDPKDMSTFANGPMAALIKALAVPVLAAKTVHELPPLALKTALDHRAQLRMENTALRSENALLRGDYMQLQQSFNQVEDFLNSSFAPKFTCARAWEYADQALPAGRVQQRLPVGSAGLVAVDIWAMGPGKAELRFTRPVGADFAPSLILEAHAPGWQRALLTRPLAGMAGDVVLEITSEFALGLSLPTPLETLHAAPATAPLALRVWQGLPGIRLPEMASGKARHIIPASALPEPEVKGGTAKRLRGRDAFSLHPGHDGRLELVFRGIEVPMPANIAAYAQNFGPETVTLSLGPDADSRGRKIYLPSESHGQCDLDIPTPGTVDLYFSLRAPSPMASVFIRGLEICPVGG